MKAHTIYIETDDGIVLGVFSTKKGTQVKRVNHDLKDSPFDDDKIHFSQLRRELRKLKRKGKVFRIDTAENME